MFDHRQSYSSQEIEKAAGLYEPPMTTTDDSMDKLHHMHHLMLKTTYEKCQYCQEESNA